MSNNINENILEVKHLKKYFGKDNFKAVDDVSFNIKKGEVFGLVGESGCGKTTLGRCIIGLSDITSGDVYFKGQKIRSGTRSSASAVKAGEKESIVTKIQMIFQDPFASLDPRMTVRKIVSEGLYIQGIRDKKYIDDKVMKTLETVGLLPEHANRYPHEFSGGQRQRLGIARAIIMEPELIIADEPISALDVSIQAQIINLLNDLRKEMGLTILFIAHDLSVVKYFCDRIAVMYLGKIVEMAESEELFTRPLHPYTRSLISAIPFPDPDYEKKRVRMIYRPQNEHEYGDKEPKLREVFLGHYVSCDDKEFEQYKNM